MRSATVATARACTLWPSPTGRSLATCRLLFVGPTVQFSRLAVRKSARRQGIASALLARADDETRAGGARRLVLHAQTYARSLYEAAGYEPRGRVFMEAGIVHIAMGEVPVLSARPAAARLGSVPAVSEVRIDPVTGQRALLAEVRAGRPGSGLDGGDAQRAGDPGEDPFAEGNEASTPPELYAVRSDGSAAGHPRLAGARSSPNRYPVLEPDAADPPPSRRTRTSFLDRPARGARRGDRQRARPGRVCWPSLGPGAGGARRRRVARADARSRRRGLCAPDGQRGARTPGQRCPTPTRSCSPWSSCRRRSARERERFGAYATRTMGGNLLGDLLQQEVRRRERIVAIDSEAVLVAAWAARVPYQLMIIPRAPRMRFEDPGPTGAALLHDALSPAAATHPARRGAAQPVGAHRAPGAPSTSAGGSRSSRGSRTWPASSSAPGSA